MTSRLCDVLLIAADWQSRALLVAELEEAGYSVTAAPGLHHALRALLAEPVHARLILLDAHEDPDATPGYVRQLPGLLPGVALLVLVGVYEAAAWEPLRDYAVEILRRPLTIGEVIEAVQRCLIRKEGRQMSALGTSLP